MDTQTSRDILRKVREKRAAEPATVPYAQQPKYLTDLRGRAAQLQHDAVTQGAVTNIGKMLLASLGVGAAARGGVGLLNVLRTHATPQPSTSGPAILPLPYPVEPEESPRKVLKGQLKTAEPLPEETMSGNSFYYPGMLTAGMGGLMLGWKGVDSALQYQHQKDKEEQLDKARQEFHKALLSQYRKPLQGPGLKLAADDDLGPALDRLYDKFVKTAWPNKWSDLPLVPTDDTWGRIKGLYGAYALATGGLAGAWAYDKTKSRSENAILQKAIQRRQRRQFAQQPPEIYAVPEPVRHVPSLPVSDELQTIHNPPEEP